MSLLVLLSIASWWALPSPVAANAAEPPSIVILVPGMGSETEIEMLGVPRDYEKPRTERFWLEDQFAFYTRGDAVRITTPEDTFDLAIPEIEGGQRHMTIFTLDTATRTLSPGKSLLRSVLFIGIRVSVTLLVEALVFGLFGLRERRSWLAFLIVNLITQLGLNLALNTMSIFSGYWWMPVILFEIGILIAELIVLPRLIREKRRSRWVGAVIVANVASLVVGLMLIPRIPL